MPGFPLLWALFTVAAAGTQTLRNAVQRELTVRVGTAGATQVRFLYGLPFVILFFAVVVAVEGPPPMPAPAFFLWTGAGGIAQILATGLLLAAMRDSGFVTVVAYSKTEPVQVALFGALVLGDPLTLGMAAAVTIATGGVMLMSWPKAGASSLAPVAMGIASGGCFATAAVGFRGGILALGSDSFVLGATTTLLVGIAIQTAVTALYMAIWDRRGFVGVLAAWRPSLLAGLAGATASQFWFLAFAIESAARVRTLALVEILFAQLISMKLFREGLSRRETIGLVLVVLGCALVLNA